MSQDLEPTGPDERQPTTRVSESPFPDLIAPQPAAPDPGLGPRLLAFGAILIGGLLGALIGFGVADILTTGQTWPAVGGLLGGIIGAVGVGVLANLTLRAMHEWNSVKHPEASEAQPNAATTQTTSEGRQHDVS